MSPAKERALSIVLVLLTLGILGLGFWMIIPRMACEASEGTMCEAAR